MANEQIIPDRVLVSPARRTRETWDQVAAAGLEVRPELRLDERLFHATPATLLEVLRGATESTVMIIGHNPGIAEFAASLPARVPLDPEFRSYPTAATLVVDFQIDKWADLQPGQGSVMDFVRLDGR